MFPSNPVCFTHRDRPTTVPSCATCRRIAMERDIVTRTVDVLLAAGYALTTDADETDESQPTPTADRAAILKAMCEVDDEYLKVWRPSGRGPMGWVRFVYGNDGWDVINDYTINLEDVLQPITAYCDSLT